MIRRLFERLWKSYRAQVALWERYLEGPHAPTPQRVPMRWVRSRSGWRLRGSVLPQPPAGERLIDQQ